jgi:molybdopterin-binding protein
MKECPEVANKTIRKLTIFDEDATAPEVVIELLDGTVFTASFTTEASVQARLTLDEGGEPRVLADYLP